jgi:ribosomal protein S18 acetylase RimI-like enzyme
VAVIVRDALPGELAEVGDLRVAAYQADGFLSPESRYAPTLRALGADGDGTVLVAVDDGGDGGDDPGAGGIVGTVMLQFWPNGGEVRVGREEAEVRALAVAPGQQGHGTGRALLRAAIGRAARRGVRHLVLLTQPEMRAAQHLYEQAGFRRLPERDWAPVPGVLLLAYGLTLAGSGAVAEGKRPLQGPGPQARADG